MLNIFKHEITLFLVSLCLNENQVLQALHCTFKTLENQRISHVFKDHVRARKTLQSFQTQRSTERKNLVCFLIILGSVEIPLKLGIHFEYSNEKYKIENFASKLF